MILSWLIGIPIGAAILSWLVARWSEETARWIALVACLADFGVTIYLWVSYRHMGFTGDVAIEHRVAWVPSLGIGYHLAMDGLSLLLILLTSTIGVVAVACSWREITYKVGAFHLTLLLLLAGIFGVFLAYDLLLFYFFWELMLIPMYFLIAIWGHENRRFAAIKFFLFTFISGFFMLVGILGIYVIHGRATGIYTFDFPALLNTPMSSRHATWLMAAFFVGLSVKMPIFPLHTWLPDAHTEAPTAGSVDLAGLLLKTGAYGLMRFAIPLFPVASAAIAPAAVALGTAGIVYGAAMAFAQRDFKRMVAYTSVSHMGFVVMGIYSGTELALQGALMAIIAHGIATGSLFLIVGMVQERAHTRDLNRLGGLWTTMPKLGGFTMLFALAALGLPGLGNFIGEFLVLIGTYQQYPVMAIIGAAGLVLAVVYALKIVQNTVWGPNTAQWDLPDLNRREVAILGSMGLIILWLGLYPLPIFNTARSTLVGIERALSVGEVVDTEGGR